MRLLIVTTHAIQYFAPLYRELARRPGIDLTVAYSTDLGMRETFDRQFGRNVKWDVPLTEGYRWVVMPEHAGGTSIPGPLQRRNWSVWRLVAEHDAVLLSSFLSVTDQVAVWSAVAHGKPILYRSETPMMTKRTGWGRALRVAVLPQLFRLISGAIYPGVQARAYLKHYGVPDERLHFGPYAVDNERFVKQAAELLPNQCEIRKSFGLDPSLPVILFCGKPE